jgi:hypothetical protein
MALREEILYEGYWVYPSRYSIENMDANLIP